MIIGTFGPYGRPHVECGVLLPRLNRMGIIAFQVDTGADHTCLHPADAAALDIQFGRLNRNRMLSVTGVGGTSQYYQEVAGLVFRDTRRDVVSCSVDLLIAEPDDRNAPLNSLLGLDVINRWRMDYAPLEGRLHFFAE